MLYQQLRDMKKTRLAALVITLFGYYTLTAQAPSGAYKATETQYGDTKQSKEELSRQPVIKLFKDGHWIVASFGDSAGGFQGTAGGTYKIVNGKYVEHISFFSWDSTAVGKSYIYDYTLNGNEYSQDGYMNSDKYKAHLVREKYAKLKPEEPLNHQGLEGTWKMQSGQWGEDKLGEGQYQNVTAIKIYAYPRFAFAYYNDLTKSLVGAGGGTYQFDGTMLRENIQYFSWGMPADTKPSFQVTISDNKFTQTDLKGTFKETWKKMK
jgi:hypothetical protein